MRPVLILRLRETAELLYKDRHLALLFSMTIGYVLTFSYISIMKYYSFGATFDLGLWNQLYWLTLHGGPAAWDRYAYYFNWQYPYHKSSFALFLPFYAIYPHPETLLVLQTVVIGLAAIPLYFLTLTYVRRRPLALLISFAYLAYYPTENANLFNFQSENMFPLFFLLAVHFWKSHNKIPFTVCTLVVALTSPLSLLTMVLFLLYVTYQGQSRNLLALRHPRTMLKPIRSRPVEVSLIVILAGIFMLENAFGLIYGYVGYQQLQPSLSIWQSLWQSLLTSPDAKIRYFVMLLAPLIFLPLLAPRLDPLVWILSMPFVAYTLFSPNPALWQVFGLQYPLAWAPILFLGTIRWIGKLRSFDPKESHEQFIRSVSVMLLLTTLIFAAVYSPIGPLNPYIEGGYGAGNADLHDIINVNTAEAFQHEVIALVPQDASVLTQNDIPELSGRYDYQVAITWFGAREFRLTPVIPYDYILANSRSFWFPPLLPYVNEGLRNGTFGILAMGYGTILLKKGYTGHPVLYVPFKEAWTPEGLPIYSGYRVGNIIVHNSSERTSDFSFWYGPYVSLPPGGYVVNFTLMVQNVAPRNASIITLDIVSENGTIHSSRTLNLGDFSQPNKWETFSLEFNLTEYAERVEFRGMYVTNATDIAMAGVSLNQTSACVDNC